MKHSPSFLFIAALLLATTAAAQETLQRDTTGCTDLEYWHCGLMT